MSHLHMFEAKLVGTGKNLFQQAWLYFKKMGSNSCHYIVDLDMNAYKILWIVCVVN